MLDAMETATAPTHTGTTPGQTGGPDLRRATSLTGGVSDYIRQLFSLQPLSVPQQQTANALRTPLIQCANTIIENIPAGPDRTVALRKLREVWTDCVSAISFGG